METLFASGVARPRMEPTDAGQGVPRPGTAAGSARTPVKKEVEFEG